MQSNITKSLMDYVNACENVNDAKDIINQNAAKDKVKGQINYINGSILGSKINFEEVTDAEDKRLLMMLLVNNVFKGMVALMASAGPEQKGKLQGILSGAQKEFRDFLLGISESESVVADEPEEDEG